MGKVPSCDMENVLSFPLAMSLVRFYFLLSTALVLPPQEFCGPSKLFFHLRDLLRRLNSCCHQGERNIIILQRQDKAFRRRFYRLCGPDIYQLLH